MALVSRKAFAELVERNPAAVAVDLSHGKVATYPGDKSKYDTENPLNAAYIRRWQYKNNVELLGESAAMEKAATGPPERKRFETREIRQKIEIENAKGQKKVDQDEKKRELEMENLQLKIQREQLLLDKAAGKLLPIDLVEGVLKRHGNSFLKNFEKGIENIASIFCNIMAGGDQKYYVRIMEETRQILSQCIEKSGSDAEQEVDQLVEDYSETLLRGPKKV